MRMSGSLQGLNTVDVFEQVLRPGDRYDWTLTASGDGRLYFTIYAIGPSNSHEVLQARESLRAGPTLSGSFTVPQVVNVYRVPQDTTKVVFRFSRVVGSRAVSYELDVQPV